MLLNQGYSWFKFICRERGFQVRDFEFSDENNNDDEKIVNDLMKERKSLEKKLKLFCQTTFAETFANWMHLKVIRCFVEAVLRYGLPVDFSVSCVKVKFYKFCLFILCIYFVLFICIIYILLSQIATKRSRKKTIETNGY